ncbi:MAG: hypothetical protein ACO1SX_25005, partial [Actinomycetota bacterium]
WAGSEPAAEDADPLTRGYVCGSWWPGDAVTAERFDVAAAAHWRRCERAGVLFICVEPSRTDPTMGTIRASARTQRSGRFSRGTRRRLRRIMCGPDCMALTLGPCFLTWRGLPITSLDHFARQIFAAVRPDEPADETLTEYDGGGSDELSD